MSKGCIDEHERRIIPESVTETSSQQADAFELVLRQHHDILRAFAFRLVGTDTDDVLQTAYLAAFRALSDFRGDASLGTWLHRIVYTTAMNHIRSRRRWFRADTASCVAAGVDVAGQVSARLDLERIVASLPIDQRAALLLVDGQGFSYEEAGDVLGVAAGTIASRLSRARARVRTAVATEEAT